MTSPKIADKAPIKVTLEKDKMYFFCTCGYSNQQPFCDGSHKTEAPEFKCHKFEAEEDGDVWLCQCKQTDGVPFCDGSHKKL